MPIETATYIDGLNSSYPQGTDPLADTDDHLRLIKNTVKATFPNVTGAVTGTQTTLNRATDAFANAGTLAISNNGTVGAIETLAGPTGGQPIRIANTGTNAGAGKLSVAINNAAGTLVADRLTVDVNGHVAAAGDLLAGGLVKQAGNALVPTGVIVMWYGSVASIPAGWVLCDGTNGTPDLRDRFVVGAGSTYVPAVVGGATSATGTTTTAADHNHGGSTGQAGSHNHSASTNTVGAHAHAYTTGGTSISVDQMPSHGHPMQNHDSSGGGGGPGNQIPGGGGGSLVQSSAWTLEVGGNQPHYHSIVADGDHSHAVTVTGVGDHSHGVSAGGSHNHTVTVTTLPPFRALCYIMKT